MGFRASLGFRGLNYGDYGIFLDIWVIADFISSTVPPPLNATDLYGLGVRDDGLGLKLSIR